MLGQHIHLFAVLVALGEQLDLGQHLVGERIAHHEAGVARGTTQVHQAAFSQQDDLVAAGQHDVIHLGLDVVPGVLLQGHHIDLVIEVADVANDRLILHLDQVVVADHAEVTGGRHKDVHIAHHVVEAHHPVALHRGLQGTDGVDLSDHHGSTKAPQRLG